MLGGPELTIILVIVLVLFGGSQLPKLARNLGRAQKEFKDGLDQANRDAGDGDGSSSNVRSAGDGDGDDPAGGGGGDAGDVTPSG